MDNNKFIALKSKGNNGERFFYERHNELLVNPVILEDMTDWNIEGSDWGAERLQMTPIEGAVEQFIGFCDLPNILTGCQAYHPETFHGGVEVKYVGHDQFLPRYGVYNDRKGTLGFGVWNGTEDLSNGKTKYLRSEHGNLRRWMEPSVDNRGARPMILVFLLATIDIDRMTGKSKERFFASIAFENVDALLERLTEYAADFGLDLKNWDDQIPTGDAAQDFTVPGLLFQGNMWHVPMSVIGDLATVTMIGDDPKIYPTGQCSAVMQQSRLDNLKKLAAGRWIPQEKSGDNEIPSDRALYDLWHRKLLIGTRYPNMLDKNGKELSI